MQQTEKAIRNFIFQAMQTLTIAVAIRARRMNPGIIDMSIGILAIGFSLVCGMACLLSAGLPEPNKIPSADYTGIYETIQIKEI